ncbi:Nuclear pore complex protein [Monoraphidium neglectum]|uniref:Nuclear pore complex protein n=1 Tax=Monoraphidium neglectum TaxID=145388 RepID=A0A0D2KHT0_9CHLO|nr:Nuclear pore complex protein [Monoraphidium neglectum]KIY95383.1 Nuclear pore complex protein [Monoraphidium neglectum]|eukprot:XP_013894403.1 Nuclear pore complex protein [Monoraphidium neglectum]
MDVDDDEYAGAPPLLVVGEQLQQQEEADDAAAALSLEDRFAGIVQELMRDEVDVAEALLAFKEVSTSQVEQLRDRASSLLHRSAHYLHARQLAEDLESQGATWELLLHLYATGEQPAGMGGPPLPGAGGRQTYRQAVRGAVNGDASLERVAHVVAWLESLAAQRLAARPPLGFSAADGVWRETLLLSHAGGGGGGGGGGELDPDAPSRGATALRGEDQRNEERLAAQLWQLMRAGKLQQAQDLCRRCGQDWRAAALSGGGPWGPLPVGAAAADADERMDDEWQAEDLAAEVEGGRGAGRALWRWSCAAAADAAASAAPANRWEAALFGALASHVPRVLPVCGGWEDEAWAYCRAWLDLGADEKAAEEAEAARASFGDADSGAAHGAADALAIPSDVLASLLDGAASSGYSRTVSAQLLQEGLSVASSEGGAAVAKLQRLRRDGDRSLVPASFDDLRALLAASPNPSVRAAAGQQQRALQLDLMAERWRDLVLELAGAAMAAYQQQQPRPDAAAAAAAEGGGALLRRAGDQGFALLRFAAHLALALRALGLVRDPGLMELQARAHGVEGLDDEEEQEAARLQEVRGPPPWV